LRNENAPAAQKDLLRKNNWKAFKDIYYKAISDTVGAAS